MKISLTALSNFRGPLLVSTKLVPPRVARDVMIRPRLVSCFDPQNALYQLTCVVAPAGYGKSTLLYQWHEKITMMNIPSGWVSLDDDDNDPSRFIAYIAAAVKSILPKGKDNLIPQFETGVVNSPRLILDSIQNWLAESQQPFFLFLDDCHRVTDSTVWQMTDWLISHASENAHFVIAGRSQPQLSVNKLKTTGQLLWLGPNDLRLKLEETRQFINEVQGFDIPATAIEALTDRTEGWFAGLRLLTTSIKNIANKEQFIKTFSGTDEDITSYLGEVVLAQQSNEMRSFLLRASILERFNADLCNKVSGVTHSQLILDKAYANNLFLVPLDRRAEWYRFHHLFADFLSTRFKRESPEQVIETYRTASAWFAAHDLQHEAIQYSLAASDHERAAELIAGVAEHLVRYRGEHRTLLNWLKALPEHILERWPEDILCWAWSLVLLRNFDAADRQLCWLEEYCRRINDKRLPRDVTQLNYLMLKSEVVRCVKLGMIDDSRRAMRATMDWLERWPDAESYDLGVANNVLGIASISTFEFGRGLEAVQRAAESFARCGASYGVAWADALRGIILIEQGRLAEAFIIVESALDRAKDTLGRQSYSGRFLSIVLADILYERGDLTAAEDALQCGFPSAHEHGILESTYAAYKTMAKILFATGQLETALETLREGERLGSEKVFGRLSLALRGEQIAMYLRAGQKVNAANLAEQSGFFSPTDSVPGLDTREVTREIPKITACRLWIRSGQSAKALPLLTALIRRAKKAGRMRKVIELLVLKAHAAWAQGSEGPALRAFADAIEIGQPEGFYRVFIDEGTETLGTIVARMIEVCSVGGPDEGSGVPLDFLRRLAHGLGISTCGVSEHSAAETISATTIQLTKREQDVLARVAEGLSNRELSRCLFISQETVKWHLYNLYEKLGVHNRAGAIAAGRRLNLIQ